MDESFDLAGIQNATGIRVQRLRYVIDQGLLPGGSGPSWQRGRGTPRVFTAYSAFGVACAALLLKAGLRLSVIKRCMEIVCSYNGDRHDVSEIPLYQAFMQRSTAHLEVGDGDYIRLQGSEDYLRHPLSFGWIDISTREVVEMYEPLVTIRIDVARLRRLMEKRR
jgi:hypothetical protein